MPPKDLLWDILDQLIPLITPRCIVVLTSKIVSIHEGRCIKQEDVSDKEGLIIQEAEKYLPRDATPHGYLIHTIKNHTLIPTAGIDESNANGYYILPLQDPNQSAKNIYEYLKPKLKTSQFGVIITDSHSVPMRWGVVGISQGYFGFNPLIDYRNSQDVFGRILKVSMANIPDAISGAATLVMGEGSQQTPIAIVSELPKEIEFSKRDFFKRSDDEATSPLPFYIPMEEDLFKPILEAVPWKEGGSILHRHKTNPLRPRSKAGK